MKKLFLLLVVTGICASQAFATCQANFTWQQTANNVITFTNTSTGTSPNTAYHWTFGNNDSYWAQNPVYTYSIPGIYYVCLQAIDSLGNCNSTYCDSVMVTGNIICNLTLTTSVIQASCGTCSDGSATVTVSNATQPFTFVWNTVPQQTTSTATGLAPGTYTVCVTDANACTACDTVTIDTTSCLASFTWMQTANNTIAFTSTSIGNSFFTDYHWTFGDNTQGYSQNPTHYYNVPGTYIVCLQISDSLSAVCNNTFCDTVTVTGVNCNNISASTSWLDASCGSCADGSATVNPTGGTPPYSYLWSNSGTTQTISNLSSGYYTVIVTDAIGCTASAAASIDSMGNCNSYFTISYVSPQTYNGVNLATGVPPISYTWSWGDNTASYTAYPTHTYASAGYYLICLTINDSTGCSSTYCDSFNIVRMTTPFSAITVTIFPSGPNGIANMKSENFCSVFPNPAADYLYIDYSLAASANAKIALYDVLGNTIRSFSDDVSDGKHELTFDIRSLKQGVYLLSLQTRDYSITRRVIVVK